MPRTSHRQFNAECAFCHLALLCVPDYRLGHSVKCPRCRNCFTLVEHRMTAATGSRLPPIEAPPVHDYFGVGSFGLGSYAFLVAALTHERSLAIGLGLAGLLCGVIGLFSSLSKQQVSLLVTAGLIVCLPPVFVAVLVPDWLGLHLVGNHPNKGKKIPAVRGLPSSKGRPSKCLRWRRDNLLLRQHIHQRLELPDAAITAVLAKR
jgi:hypothetical protein